MSFYSLIDNRWGNVKLDCKKVQDRHSHNSPLQKLVARIRTQPKRAVNWGLFIAIPFPKILVKRVSLIKENRRKKINGGFICPALYGDKI